MRIIPLKHIDETQILGNNIYDADQRLLLSKGTMITASNKSRLLESGYISVYISDVNCKNEPKPIIPISEINMYLRVVKHAYDDFKTLMELRTKESTPAIKHQLKKQLQKRDTQMQNILQMTEGIIDKLIDNKHKKIEYIVPKNTFTYRQQHAISSGIIAVLIGFELNKNINELKSLFIASILSEMGNLTIPPEILYKKEQLTASEFDIIKEHCMNSYHEVNNYGDLNYIIKNICLEHHEKVDGSGYPNGLQGDQINSLSKILSVADAYDALISDRTYRHAFPPSEALNLIQDKKGIHYDNACVDALENIIEIFPAGLYVQLNSKLSCIVTQSNLQDSHRPIVKVLDKHAKDQIIDMSKYPDFKITGIKYNI